MNSGSRGARGICRARFAAFALAIVLVAGAAGAEGRRPGAGELMRAIELIREDRCDAAVPLLRESYERGRFKNALWNLAECYVLMNRPDLAIATYQEYIDHPRIRSGEVREAREAITELEGRLATVTVTGNVEGATLQVDGQEAGSIPAEVRVGPGEHTFAATSPGYGTWTQVITTGSGEDRRLEAELRPVPGQLSVAADSAGAAVWIDGEDRGPAPFVGDLDGGAHVVEVRRRGMRTARRQVAVLPGQRSGVTIPLEPTGGTLSVGADAAEAQLRVDGQPRATSPFGPLALTPGRYALAVSAPGHRRWTGAVDVLDERVTRVDVDLASTGGLHQGWFWSLTALTVSTLAAGTALVLVGREHLGDFDDDARFVAEAESGLLTFASTREEGQQSFDQAQAYDIAGWSLVGAAGLSLVTTLVVGLLTRFTEEPSEAEVSLEDEDEEVHAPDAGGSP